VLVAVYLPLVLPALAVPVVRWVAGRLHPAWASWLVLVSALVLAVCATFALCLLVFAALLAVRLFPRPGHWQVHVVHHLGGVHLPIDLAASVLLLVFGAMSVSVGATRFRSLTEARRLAGQGRGELIVVEADEPMAHAVPGRPGRIVVSTGMLAGLAPAERRALLAHERAHLAGGHHLFVAVVDVLAAANPLLRPLTTVIRYTTERWADEVAAGKVGDRSVVAMAVGKAALAGRAPLRSDGPRTVATGPVPRRVAALLASPPAGRVLAVLMSPVGVCAVIAFALVAGSVWFSLDAMNDLHRTLQLAQH
jgi:hypothetical protein